MPQPVLSSCPSAQTAPTVTAIDPSGDWEIRWDRSFAGWHPAIFEGKLSLHRQGEQWTGQIAFVQSSANLSLKSVRVQGDEIDLVFRPDASLGAAKTSDEIELNARIRDDRLIGEMRWGRAIGWTPMGGRRLVLPALTPLSVDHTLAKVDLAQLSGIDTAALHALVEHATAERSSALVLLVDGRIGLEMYRHGYDGGPLVAMSASKSIVSLAVGLLIGEGKLSLDTRMDALFPEWRKLGAKSSITVRELLTHTSGLDPARADWNAGESIRDHALHAKLVFPPGTRFQYDNDAVDFLAAVVERAAGMPLDAYLEARLFQRLGIVGAHWMKDSAGTPRGAGELYIRPIDLAKVGQLMLDEGAWQGAPIVSSAWIRQSIVQGQPFDADCGFLWWREGQFAYALTDAVLAGWRDLGIPDPVLRQAHSLVGHSFASYKDYISALGQDIGRDALERIDAAVQKADHVPLAAEVSDGPVRGFSARGWLGQYLVVLPAHGLVAVRMRAPESGDYDEGGAERYGYPSFVKDVSRLFP